MHHWSDWRAGIAELRRVARRRIVVLTFDPAYIALLAGARLPPRDHRPHEACFPPLRPSPRRSAGRRRTVPIPADCRDGFLCAGGAAARYLDETARANISSFAMLPAEVVTRRSARLERDVADGTWAGRNAAARARPGRLRLSPVSSLDQVTNPQVEVGYLGSVLLLATRSACRQTGLGATRERIAAVAVRCRNGLRIAPERATRGAMRGARSIAALAIQASGLPVPERRVEPGGVGRRSLARPRGRRGAGRGDSALGTPRTCRRRERIDEACGVSHGERPAARHVRRGSAHRQPMPAHLRRATTTRSRGARTPGGGGRAGAGPASPIRPRRR